MAPKRTRASRRSTRDTAAAVEHAVERAVERVVNRLNLWPERTTFDYFPFPMGPAPGNPDQVARPKVPELPKIHAPRGPRANKERVELVRRRLSEKVSQRKIAREVYPDVDLDVAYSRLRAFIKDHRLSPRR